MAVITKSKNAQQVSSAKVHDAAGVLVYPKNTRFYIGTAGKKKMVILGIFLGFIMVDSVILMVNTNG